LFDLSAANNPLIVVAAFILVLIPAVIIHELGHFLTAKLVGITILEFGIGMPPRAIRLGRWRETDITVNWLPLGGFVRPLGEDMIKPVGDEASMSDREEAIARGVEQPKSVNETAPLKRILFMAGGALANFIMAFVLFVIIALTGLPQIIGARLQVVSLTPDSPLVAAGLVQNDLIEAIDGQPITNSSQFWSVGEGSTLTIRREGVDEPFDIVLTSSSALFADEPVLHPLIIGVANGSPAALSGLQAGDAVLSLDGQSTTTYDELQALTRERLGQEVTLEVWRNGSVETIQLTPRANPPQNQGAMGIQITSGALSPATGLLVAEGTPVQELVPLSFGDAVRYSVDRIGSVLGQLAQVPGQIISAITTSSNDNENLRVTSPLGISQVGGVLLQESIQQRQPSIILEYIALISLALGLTNLLPIPALDGGRILFVLIEMVRGRPIAPEREGMVHLVGLALLLSLMVVVVINDIMNPLTDLLR